MREIGRGKAGRLSTEVYLPPPHEEAAEPARQYGTSQYSALQTDGMIGVRANVETDLAMMAQSTLRARVWNWIDQAALYIILSFPHSCHLPHQNYIHIRV